MSSHHNNVSHSVLRWEGGMERDNGGCLQEIAQRNEKRKGRKSGVGRRKNTRKDCNIKFHSPRPPRCNVFASLEQPALFDLKSECGGEETCMQSRHRTEGFGNELKE